MVLELNLRSQNFKQLSHGKQTGVLHTHVRIFQPRARKLNAALQVFTETGLARFGNEPHHHEASLFLYPVFRLTALAYQRLNNGYDGLFTQVYRDTLESINGCAGRTSSGDFVFFSAINPGLVILFNFH